MFLSTDSSIGLFFIVILSSFLLHHRLALMNLNPLCVFRLTESFWSYTWLEHPQQNSNVRKMLLESLRIDDRQSD